jgi:hypothetical protein
MGLTPAKPAQSLLFYTGADISVYLTEDDITWVKPHATATSFTQPTFGWLYVHFTAEFWEKHNLGQFATSVRRTILARFRRGYERAILELMPEFGQGFTIGCRCERASIRGSVRRSSLRCSRACCCCRCGSSGIRRCSTTPTTWRARSSLFI